MTEQTRVHISGAGPVGLVLALALCRKGVPVTVLEAEPNVCQDLRSTYYHAPSVDMLGSIGYLDKLLTGGTRDTKFRFTDVALGRQVEVDLGVLGRRFHNPFSVSAAQNWFTRVGYELLQDCDCEFLFRHRVVAASQTGQGVVIRVATPEGEKDIRSDWLIGCDGGGSKTRSSQNIPFEGFTWSDRFLLIHVRHDFEPEFGRLDYRANGPDWRLVIRVPFGPGKQDWTYRIVSRVGADDGPDAVLDPAFLQARLQSVRPSVTPYEITAANIYNVHQQVAQTYRKGRIVLAGDAAHLNNPIGGQGLNCGIHDAFNLADKFATVWHGAAPESLLDLYDRQRRLTNWEYIQKVSIENKQRNEETDLDKRAATMTKLEKTVANDGTRLAFLYRWSMGESLDYAAAIA